MPINEGYALHSSRRAGGFTWTQVDGLRRIWRLCFRLGDRWRRKRAYCSDRRDPFSIIIVQDELASSAYLRNNKHDKQYI